MGSFDVACSASRLTIHPGDPVAYIALEPSKYRYQIDAENNTLIYPWCYYTPIGLPILGEYYDYGYLDEFQENEATKALCDYLGCSIDKVVGADGNLPCVGMFVHRGIYDALVEANYDEWGGREEKLLRAKAEVAYDKWQQGMKSVEDAEETMKMLTSFQFREVLARFFGPDLEFETISKICAPLVKQGVMKKEMVDFKMFMHGMHACNVFFFPAMNGYQHGNDYASRLIYTKALEIANDNIKQSERERAEDE